MVVGLDVGSFVWGRRRDDARLFCSLGLTALGRAIMRINLEDID